MARAGLMEGNPDGTFAGKKATTRYEMAVILARLVQHLELDPVAPSDFHWPDVPRSHWAREAVDAVTSRRLFSVAAANFHGARKLTRYEFATIVQRVRHLIRGKSVDQSAGLAQYPDVPPAHWAADAVNRTSAVGLLEGFPDGSFRGDAPMLRYHLGRTLLNLARGRSHFVR